MKAAQNAASLIDELRIREPSEIDIARIAARYDAHVVYDDLVKEEGYLLRNDQCGIITVARHTQEGQKWRFVVAHELGHFLRHADRDQFEICNDASLHRWYRGSDEEIEANAFASEILMPARMFEPNCGVDEPTLGIIEELSREFSTSLTATALRFLRFTPELCAIAFSVDRKIKWWDSVREFPFFIATGYPVKGTYAEDVFDGRSVPDRPEEIEVDTWTTDDVDRRLVLREQSMRLGRYGVISLLWIPDRSDDGADGIAEEDEGNDEDRPWSYHGFRFHRR